MESIASELKTQREKKNITLSQMATDTYISVRHLQSLEEGQFESLPGGMYNRAIIRAYCEALGLDQAEMLRRYESEITPSPSKPDKSSISSSIKIPPLAIWSLMLIISVISIFLTRKWIFPIFSPYFTKSSSIQDHVAVPPPPAPVSETTTPAQDALIQPTDPAVEEKQSPLPSETTAPPATAPQSDAAAAVSAPAIAAPGNAFLLEVIGKEKCWISIESDGKSVLQKIIEPNEKYSFKAGIKFYIIIGNAGGVRLKINGKSLKKLGESGEVVQLLVDEHSLPELLSRTAS